ncbi:MAG: leucine--tRNA ligase [Planctomycetota bacterium]
MKYDFAAIESKWRERWAKDRLFAATAVPKNKYYILEMFAYPSGDIHMGHFRNYTIGDIIARYRLMKGHDVLHPFGWDAFGLPAEQAAIKRGTHPRTWTLGNIEMGKRTLQRMAISYDWEREVRTCNPDYYRWTQWMFLLLHRKGLAYRAKSPVNWCDTCKTGLANEQVHDGKCWRCGGEVGKREYEQWHFRLSAYAQKLLDGLERLPAWPEPIKTMQRNWIGRSEGAEIDFAIEGGGKLTVFTTRADTLYGVTFMTMAPEHPLAALLAKGTPQEGAVAEYIRRAGAKSEIERTAVGEKDGVFSGRHMIHPLTGEAVPLWIGDYVLAHYGTGVVMGVPAHDARDFAFARKYTLPIRVVIQPAGQSLDPAAMTDAFGDAGVMVNSGPFDGTPSEAGIRKVTEHLAVRGAARSKVNFKIRDWLISRQRYWGCPIPMIHCEKCGIVPVPEKDLPVRLPEDVTDFVPKGRSPLADVKAFMNVPCPTCGKPARRDPDTMDTFMCSSWYQLRYTDPENNREPFGKAEAAKWLPVDLYIGGSEHACMHLIYFRFFMKVLHEEGWVPVDEPVTRLFNHGMVLDAKGEVMSKTKGNVVPPATMMDEYGVDASRMAMAFFAPSDVEILWKEEGVQGARRFIGRVFELVTDNAGWLAAAKRPAGAAGTLSPAVTEIRRLAHAALKRATEACETDFAFNTAISKTHELVNALERVGDLAARPDVEKAAIREAVEFLVGALSPIVPHLAEELWEKLGHRESVFKTPWPAFDPACLVESEVEVPVQVNGKVRSRLTLPRGIARAELESRVLADPKIRECLSGKPVRKWVVVPDKLVNLVV